ncbi:MAG: NAD(P)-dependent oxidoreductase [Tissierellia bacterium]|nr:NAD(P)-dependent oxidoreductase [Tissierellia bacterium]
MQIIYNNLLELEKSGKSIRTGIVGFGKMGKTLAFQLLKLKGFIPSVIVTRNPQKAKESLIEFGLNSENIVLDSEFDVIEEAVKNKQTIITDDYKTACKLPIDAIVDATGDTAYGANIAIESIKNKKHIIMLNVECDATIGASLNDLARENGVVYTGTSGDEPGSIMELFEFVQNVGLEIVVVGKGKNNLLDNYITNDDLVESAKVKNVSTKALTSFCDGTNTMIELTVVGNAINFKPDVLGGHGVTTTVKELGDSFKTMSEGGILNGYGIVDFAFGVAPGVFVIAKANNDTDKELLKYLNMGDGPNYVFHRPYHLTSMETPITIYKAVVENDSTIEPIYGQVCDTVTLAKRDIDAGEYLEGIGSDMTFGKITSHEETIKNDYLPIGIITKNAKMKYNIKKGQFITRSMVELDYEETIVKIRSQQDKK